MLTNEYGTAGNSTLAIGGVSCSA